MILLQFAAMIYAQGDYEGRFLRILRRDPDATFSSYKNVADLEVCVADAISGAGTPVAFNDGKDIRVLTVEGFLVAVTIKKSDTGSTIYLRSTGKPWADRLRSRVSGCA